MVTIPKGSKLAIAAQRFNNSANALEQILTSNFTTGNKTFTTNQVLTNTLIRADDTAKIVTSNLTALCQKALGTTDIAIVKPAEIALLSDIYNTLCPIVAQFGLSIQIFDSLGVILASNTATTCGSNLIVEIPKADIKKMGERAAAEKVYEEQQEIAAAKLEQKLKAEAAEKIAQAHDKIIKLKAEAEKIAQAQIETVKLAANKYAYENNLKYENTYDVEVFGDIINHDCL